MSHCKDCSGSHLKYRPGTICYNVFGPVVEQCPGCGHEAEVQRLTNLLLCDVCGGTGNPPADICACEGTHRAWKVLENVRKENYRLERERDALRTQLATYEGIEVTYQATRRAHGEEIAAHEETRAQVAHLRGAAQIGADHLSQMLTDVGTDYSIKTVLLVLQEAICPEEKDQELLVLREQLAEEKRHALTLVRNLGTEADLREQLAAAQEQAARLRVSLWLRHGCPTHLLYGDDGELQCSTCGIDFKRMSPEEISERWELKALATTEQPLEGH